MNTHGDILHSPNTANGPTINDLVYRQRPEDATAGTSSSKAYGEYNPPRGEVGWICPICGRGLAPSTSYCPCNSSRNITYTAQSSTSIYPPNGIEEYGRVMAMPVGAIDYADGSSEIIYPSVDDKSRSVD